MNSHPQQQAALEECRTLLELGRTARALGLAHVLEEPLGALTTRAELTPRTLALLAQMASTGEVRTLGALLSPGPAERWLAQHGSSRMRSQLVDAARGRLLEAVRERPAPAASPGLPPPPGSHKELETWASANGVRSKLGTPMAMIGDRLGPGLLESLQRWNATAAVGDLILEGPWARGALSVEVGSAGVELIRRAAWRWLNDEAEAIRRGIEEEEASGGEAPPEDPLLASLAEKLEAMRAAIRSRVEPWSGPQPLLDFESDPPAFVAETEPKVFPPARGKLAEVRISLTGWERGGATLSCSCGHNPCVHGLRTLDAVLHFLRDPVAEGARKPIIEELRQPAWSRTLRAIDRARVKREQREAAREDVRLSWRLQRDVDWVLRPWLQKRTRRGWSAGGRASFRDLAERRDSLDPVDRRAIEALAGGDPKDAGAIPDAFLVPRTAAALRALVGHPRVYLAQHDEPVVVREGRIGIVAIEVAGGAEVQPAIGGDAITYEELFRLVSRAGEGNLAIRVDPLLQRVTVFPVDDEVLEILRILQQHGSVFPPEGLNGLLERTASFEERLPVALPPPLRGEEVEPRRDVVLRMEPLDGPGLKVDVRIRALPGSPAFPPGEGPKEVAAADGARRFFTRRNLKAEPALVRERIASLPLRADAEDLPFTFLLDRGDEALELLAFLQEHDTGIGVEWPVRKRSVRRIGGKNLQIRVEKTRDWFGVDGHLDVDGEQVRLAVLLDAARNGARWVEVRDGVWVQLEKELLARLEEVSDHLTETRGKLHAGIAAAPALEALGEEAGSFEADASLHGLLDRIRGSANLQAPLPEGLHAELRPYQIEGFRWMMRLASWGAGACLADDMGLGKTVQALSLLLARSGEGPALVVAPTSVCGNWAAEAKRFAPDLRVYLWRDLTENRREKLLESLGPRDVIAASYGQIVRDAERLSEIRFATLVMDEAQAVKNPATQRARSMRRIDAAFRVALTGTPLENHLGELWSLFHLVFPGLLGTWQRYRERFALPIERDSDPERRKALSRLIRPFLLRRTKGEVAKELPPRIEVQVPVELSAEERRLYEDARLAAIGRLSGVDGSGPDGVVPEEHKRFEVLAAITRLRLCASHPRLYDPSSTVPSAKLARVMEIVEELREEGHRALIFSQFTSHLALVREALEERKIPYLYLDGQTPPEVRDRLVGAFQSGEGEVFLISLKAGGTGLNLTAASYVLHLDPWWNPAVEDQATDRAHRIGQDKPVTVLRLVAKGTIEEKILGLHGEKRKLIAGVLEGTGESRAMNTEELLALLRETAPAAAD